MAQFLKGVMVEEYAKSKKEVYVFLERMDEWLMEKLYPNRLRKRSLLEETLLNCTTSGKRRRLEVGETLDSIAQEVAKTAELTKWCGDAFFYSMDDPQIGLDCKDMALKEMVKLLKDCFGLDPPILTDNKIDNEVSRLQRIIVIRTTMT